MIKEEINIVSSKKLYKIFCDLYLPDDRNVRKIIIACHGFGGDKKSSAIINLAKSLTNYSIGVITFDFPGHGISNTNGYNYKVENCINDINDVENYIEEKFNNIEVGFFATSYGAYVVLLKINEGTKTYNSIVLRCPALNMRKIFEENILKIPLNEFLEKEKCILGFERNIIITKEYYEELTKNDLFKVYNKKDNILIIHGTLDDMAPIEDSIKFQKKFSKNIKLYMVKGADHRFKKPGELEEVIKIATNYILNS